MVGPEVANLKECLPVFMCLSQHNLTRKDNLTGTKNPPNSLEAWKGLREIIVFLITHDGRPLKLLECGVLKLFQQQVFFQVMQIRLYFLPASLDSQECKTTVAFWIQIQGQSKFVASSVH